MLSCILFFSLSLGQPVDSAYQGMLDGIYTNFKTISPATAESLIGKENVYFIDTREEKEFNVSHIPGAICVGYDRLVWYKINRIPRDAKIIVYCSVGARSQNIGQKLIDKKFSDVQNLYGGLFLWANQERKMVSKKDKRTSDIHGYNQEWGKWIKKGNVKYN